jgi:hypothetical protein
LRTAATTFTHLLGTGEFWAALFGALAAFLLGMSATWWANVSAKRTAGNLALFTLVQMYSLLEDIRSQLLVQEVSRQAKLLGRAPFEFEIRSVIGLPKEALRVPVEQLGFLVDSHDPDILNRVTAVGRAFESMLDVIDRHRVLHFRLQERMAAADTGGGGLKVLPRDIPAIVGTDLFIQVVQMVRELQVGLPKTRDAILSVSAQLREVLRMQFPMRHFLRFATIEHRPLTDLPPVPRPRSWRRIVRWTVDLLGRRLGRVRDEETKPDSAPAKIQRFPLSTDDANPGG